MDIWRGRCTQFKKGLGGLLCFLLWINSVLFLFCAGAGDSTYLLLDEFSVYMMLDCMWAIEGCGMEVDFISGGYKQELCRC